MAAAGPTAPSDRARAIASLLVNNLVACLALLAQFVLGMVVNLYVVLPSHHPGAGARNYFAGVASGLAWVIPNGPGWVAAHAVIGIVLIVAALATLPRSLRLGDRLIVITSVLGALAIVGAAFNGASFLNYGHAYSSMIMAGLWSLALACYSWACSPPPARPCERARTEHRRFPAPRSFVVIVISALLPVVCALNPRLRNHGQGPQ